MYSGDLVKQSFNKTIKTNQTVEDMLALQLLFSQASVDGHGFTIHTPQSGLESGSMMSVVTQTNAQNVSFADHAEDYILDMTGESDPTRWGQDSDDAQLGNFFSRPIKIIDVPWGTGTNLFNSFNPWSLYFENPRVANRLANFHLLRCNLHVKIVVNGNGFQYGRALASYLPLAQFDTLSVNSSLIPQTIVQSSQQPHVFLDPTLSRGGEMILPFFYHKNSLSIPDNNWQEMGQMTIRSINGLKHANGASDVANVSVFCWAENVYLNVLTSRESSTLSPQSGSEVDEANMKGFISGPATAVAGAANVLAKVPAIAPYALATSKAASGIASLAKVLGYSRPAQTMTPSSIIPTLTSSFACTTLPDRIDKLTVDDKQELSIDPRIAGLGPFDPFCIKSMAQRESYLTSFTWAIGSAPESFLWNIRISPVVWAQSGTSPVAYHMPACCAAAFPFRYWTGTMNYRFQIVCSSFHKGRLKFVWDPNWLASNEYNTNYLEVVDISEKSDFTISVRNGQEFTLLDHHQMGLDGVTQIYSTTAYNAKEFGNGVMGVYVVNSLTTPNSTVNNDITINVYVSAGDDFEVFVPIDDFQRFVFKPQSGMEVAESENTQEKDAPAHTASTSLGNRYDTLLNMSHVYTGESIKSFRPLLKRYTLHTAFGPGVATNTQIYHRLPMYPYLRGNVAGAIHLTATTAPYTYCNTLLFHWITNMYSGFRGGMRYKVLHDGTLSNTVPIVMQANRTIVRGYAQTINVAPIATTSKGYALTSVFNTPGTANSALFKNNGFQGVTWRNSHLNSTLEVEMPFYDRDRFVPGKTQNWTTGVVTNRRDVESLEIRATMTGASNTFFSIFVSVAEDFQCYFFTGMPPVYLEIAPPP